MAGFGQVLGDAFAAGAGRPVNREQINENAMRSVYLGAETQDAFARAALSSTQAQAAEQRLQAQQNVGAALTKLLISAGMDPDKAAERGQVYATIQLSGGNLEQTENAVSKAQWNDIEADATNPKLRGTKQQQIAQNYAELSGHWKPDDRYQPLPGTGYMYDKFSGNMVLEPMTALAIADQQAQIHQRMQAGGGAQLDPATIQALGAKYALTGQVPPMGMQGGHVRTDIYNAAVTYGTQLAQSEGRPSDPASVAQWMAENQQNFGAQTAGVKKATTGAWSDTYRSLNNVVGHLGTFRDLATELGNGTFVPGNQVDQLFQKYFGQPAPTNLQAAAAIVAPELERYIRGGGTGSQEETQEFRSALPTLGSSPQQAVSTINNVMFPILRRQGVDLAMQYHAATGRNDFYAPGHFLDNETLNFLGVQPNNGAPAANTGGQSPVAPAGGGSIPGPAGAPPASTGNPPRLNVSPVAPSSGGGQSQVPPTGAPPPISEEDYLNQAMAQLHPGFNRAVTPQLAPVNAGVQQ